MSQSHDEDADSGALSWAEYMALPVEFRRRIREEEAALSAALDVLRAEVEREEAELAVQQLRRQLEMWPTYQADG